LNHSVAPSSFGINVPILIAMVVPQITNTVSGIRRRVSVKQKPAPEI